MLWATETKLATVSGIMFDWKKSLLSLKDSEIFFSLLLTKHIGIQIVYLLGLIHICLEKLRTKIIINRFQIHYAANTVEIGRHIRVTFDKVLKNTHF